MTKLDDELGFTTETLNNVKYNLQTLKENDKFLEILNVLTNLMTMIEERPTKARYNRLFESGKLKVMIEYDGMK